MANEKEYNYETIDNPYNNSLKRGESSSDKKNYDFSLEQRPQSKNELGQANVDKLIKRDITGDSLANIYLKTWIRSNKYITKVLGFEINGLTGYLEFNNPYLTAPIINYVAFDVQTSDPTTPTGSMWYHDSGATEEFRGEVSDGTIHSFDTTVI